MERYGVPHPYPLPSQWRSVHQDFSWADSQPMTSRFLWNSCKIPQKSSFFVIFGLAPTFVACASQPQIEALFPDLQRFIVFRIIEMSRDHFCGVPRGSIFDEIGHVKDFSRKS